MPTLEEWMAEYGESHRDPVNRRIHRICVPAILWSVVGFASLARVDGSFWRSGAPVLSALSLAFYLTLGARPFLEMLLTLGACLALCFGLERLTPHAWAAYVLVFVAAWIGQAVGHVREGRKPSFFKDVQFLLIGPLWILRRH